MSSSVGVVLLGVGDDALADEVAVALGRDVPVACDAAALPVTDAVVGIAGSPWPGWDRHHDAARAAARAPYFAVASWHRHPRLVDALRSAAGRGLADLPGAHVLLTAPDAAGRAVAPEERVFLREAVQDVADEESLRSATIAWDHAMDEDAVAPTVETVLTSLAEAHGRQRVVLCALGPGTPADAHAAAVAERAGMRLVQVAPDVDDLVACLAAVVDTVLEHEGSL